jgi:hypothetical protein
LLRRFSRAFGKNGFRCRSGFADGIVNHAAAGLERDLRDAAQIVLENDRPVALIPRLMSDLAKIANATTDTDTHRRLRRLLGEAQ